VSDAALSAAPSNDRPRRGQRHAQFRNGHTAVGDGRLGT
jgi:hypothetical protein